METRTRIDHTAAPDLAQAAAQLSLSRDARVAAAIGADGVEILDVASGRTVALDVAADAVAAFPDQVWVVAGHTLQRFALTGAPIGAPVALPPGGALVRAPAGVAAIWQSTPPVELEDDLGAIAARRLDAAAAFPVQPRRPLLIRHDGAIALPQRTLLLSDRAPIAWASPLFGGASILLLTRAGHQHELRVVAARDGRLVHRIPVPAPRAIAIATQTARVALLADDRLIVVDARLGRVAFDGPVDIEAIALDDRGTAAVLRGGRIEVAPLDALLLAPVDPIAPIDEPAPEPAIEAPAPAPVPPPMPAVAAIPLRRDLGALGPRPAPAPSSDHARRCLDAERDVIAARALLAIARSWDSRRLGYPSESAHPFELEVAALLGVGSGHAAEHVAAATERLDAARARRAALDAAPAQAIADELGLSPLERELLLLVAAPTLWGEMARLYGVLANDPRRALVDEHLLCELVDGASRYDVAAALAEDAPLLRHAITAGDRPRPFAPLAVDPVLCARLRGDAAAPIPGVEVRHATVALDGVIAPRDRLARLCDELAAPRATPVRLVVRGRRGSGRRTLLAALAGEVGRALGAIDATTLDAASLSHALRQASLRGLLPCLVGATAATAAAVRAHPGPVAAIAGPDDDPPFAPGHVAIELPALAAGERLACWTGALARHGVTVDDPELLAARYRLPPGAIETACAQARGGGSAEIDAAVRQQRDHRLGRLATRVERLGSWADLVLPPEILDSLRELIGRIRHGLTVYDAWGFDAIVTTGRGLTALFEGRPGTGKTMVAGILARELGLDLYRIDVSRLVSKWVGETEKNLAEIFDAVDDGQAIVLFDEADSLFGKRTEVKSSNDRYANLEVNYLLQRIDSFDGIAILTTNFGSAIDPAFRRRLSFRVTFPFPDEDAREQLWRCHLPPSAPIAGALELPTLARRYQMSGGYIRNACVRAAFLAAQEGSAMTQQHLERACVLEYQQIGKISTTGPVE